MISIGEIMAHARDQEAKGAGISEADIALGRKAGMLPADVAALRGMSAAGQGYCFVARCPKASAYGWQGLLPAKIGAIAKKTGTSGVVSVHKLRRDASGNPLFRNGEPIIDAAIYVSDYDLMGVWKWWKGAWQRVRIAAQNGAKRGPYGTEATELLRRLNRSLVTKIQHGCQDDWNSPDNRGVKPDDAFAAFWSGQAVFLDGAAACGQFYQSTGLGSFPYDTQSGAFRG